MNKKALFYFFFFIGSGCFSISSQAQLYKNPKLSPEVRATDLLQRMTLNEKIAQISHVHYEHIFEGQQLSDSKLHDFVGDCSWGFVEGFPLTGENSRVAMRRIQEYMLKHTRLGIPVFTVSESLHGAVHEGSTIYPQNIAMAATFNTELAYQRASAISDELHYQGLRQVLAPDVDVVRDMRWGRVEECFGEDPFLNSMFACAEVKGYLDHGISPMLKHYGAHANPTGGLNLANVNGGLGELYDIYLQPFRRVIATLPVQAVMSSYNAWNGIPNSSSYFLMTEVLRKRFGFQGYVYSDWGAIDMLCRFHHIAANQAEAAVKAISAGLDVEASSDCYPYLITLIKEKKIPESLIDTAVKRVLLAKFRLGLFEDPYGRKYPDKKMHSSENVALARKISDESVVLLKNENNILPLQLSQLKSIAVIGPNADQVQFGDYTWSHDNKDGVTPLEGIRKLAQAHALKVNYAEGCQIMSMDTTGIASAVQATQASDVAVVFCGSTSSLFVRNFKGANSGEGYDLSDLSLSGSQEAMIKAVYATGKPVVLVLVTGKPFSISWEKEHLPAILVQWYGGEQAGNSIADILFGKVVPSGHLTVSFPQSTGHLPCYYNYYPTDRGYYHNPGSYAHPGRDYVFSSPDALWGFGYGLSYTSFNYKKMEVNQLNDSIKAVVTVENTGKYAAKAVPQLYVRDLVTSRLVPIHQLKAFDKVELQPAESKRVSLSFAVQDLAITDNEGNSKVEPGNFELQLGDAADHILLRDTILIGKLDTTYMCEKSPIYEANSFETSKSTIVVNGTVCDVQATPMTGVEIYSTSQKKVIGVTRQGAYEIKVSADDILVFRKKNFSEEKVSIKGQHSIQIKMRQKGV